MGLHPEAADHLRGAVRKRRRMLLNQKVTDNPVAETVSRTEKTLKRKREWPADKKRGSVVISRGIQMKATGFYTRQLSKNVKVLEY